MNMGNGISASALSREAMDFAPGLLAIQESPPARLPRAVLYAVGVLLTLLLLWSVVGHLDIVATAEGRLVPKTYVKVVQPADAGIVKEILVHEGERVNAGQVLLRMDAQDSQADTRRLQADLSQRSLQLRRIDAELSGKPLVRDSGDSPEAFRGAEAQYAERRRSYLDSLGEAEQQLEKAQRDYDSATSVLEKLRQTNPILKSQADAYAGLGSEGYVPQITVGDKQRAYIENEKDLEAEQSAVKGLAAAIQEARQRVRQVGSKYRSDLENERVDAATEYRKLQEDAVKLTHRSNLLELKAPQAGIVKDLATHTVGTVVATGTVLLSIVPENEPLVADILIRNEDIGFVKTHQRVKVKLAAYPFQKYGLLDGEVLQVWPDASDDDNHESARQHPSTEGAPEGHSGGFRALVELDRQTLAAGGQTLTLMPGMEVIAEVREGRRTVMEYLLSPIKAAVHDSGRER
jgi:HlyD family secretion protein